MINKMKILLKLLLSVYILVGPFSAFAHDKPFTVGIVYSSWTKFDKTFSEAAYNGLVKFLEQHPDAEAKEFEMANPGQSEQSITKLAQRKVDVIVTIGFNHANALAKIAPLYPEQKFIAIDALVDAPNVASILFKEEEGSFMVGALAAMKNKTGVIGFVGGMDIPLVRKFDCGYRQGAQYVNPDIDVLLNFAGSTDHAWNDPARGSELATVQIEKGADVIYVAAGKTGMGVFKKIFESNLYAIGADSNQNDIHPGYFLTSMVKGIDAAVFNGLEAVYNNAWQSGVKHLGLKEQGVYWALDKYNQNLISQKDKAQMAVLEEKIISGEIKVHDYMVDNACVF